MKPFMEVFKESYDRSLKTWPLYTWQAGIEVLRFVTLIPCAVVVLIPIWRSRADFAGADFSRLSDTLVKLLWQSGWWKLALGVFLLYMVWWLIIEALVNGGVFGRLWAYVKDKETFSFKEYIQDGFRFFLPLIALHLLTLVTVMLVVGAPVFLISLVASGGHGGAEGSTAILMILGILFLLCLPAALFLAVTAVWWLVARGYITTGNGLMESLQLSFRKCLADKGRVFWGLNLMFLLVFAGLFAIGMVFGILQAIPFIGIVFSLINYLISLLSAAFLAVYVPSVVVTFIKEPK